MTKADEIRSAVMAAFIETGDPSRPDDIAARVSFGVGTVRNIFRDGYVPGVDYDPIEIMTGDTFTARYRTVAAYSPSKSAMRTVIKWGGKDERSTP